MLKSFQFFHEIRLVRYLAFALVKSSLFEHTKELVSRNFVTHASPEFCEFSRGEVGRFQGRRSDAVHKARCFAILNVFAPSLIDARWHIHSRVYAITMVLNMRVRCNRTIYGVTSVIIVSAIRSVDGHWKCKRCATTAMGRMRGIF